ncbi:MAG: hypothetical protein HY055_04245 [Magnetospirillum sp.]|nr:hypothetical protein [Magnetospirillum sp.]
MATVNLGGGAMASGYQITNSIRLNGTSDCLTRTPGVAGNRQKWTVSTWVKRATLGAQQCIISGDPNAGNPIWIGFNASDQLQVNLNGSTYRVTSAFYRDPSALLHVVVALDATAASLRIWVNGSEITAWATNVAVPNSNFGINNNTLHAIGYMVGYTNYFPGYLSDFYLVDGQALTPSSFGKGSPEDPNKWVPIKYSGTYGANGCKLAFGSSGALGTDTSGNGNNWTVTGSPVQTTDTPTNNYCTWNPLDHYGANTFTNGNLTASTASGGASISGTQYVSSGLWYFEIKRDASADNQFGVISGQYPAGNAAVAVNRRCWRDASGTPSWLTDGGNAGSGSAVALANGDTLQVALDLTNGAAYFGKNGTWMNSGVPTSGASKTGAIWTDLSGNSWAPFIGGNAAEYGTANFGATAFAYAPPTGFKALCTANLPAVAIPQPKKHFDVSLRGGTSATANVTGKLFQPDLSWTKARSAAADGRHSLYDSVRGANKRLSSNLTNAEATDTDCLMSFNSDGVTFGSDAANNLVNQTGQTYVDWLWKAGGAAVTNNAGSISSQVSVNAAAGFSVGTYIPAGAAATVGHGLGAAPAIVIVKQRSSPTRSWMVYHKSLGATQYLQLESTMAAATLSTIWNSTAPTSTVFSIGTDTTVSANGLSFSFLAFAEIPGYSKAFSFRGNGSADGPFVYLGFRPRYIMIKRSDAAGNDWFIFDSARDTYNQVATELYADLAAAESSSTHYIDFTANGFKLRTSYAGVNAAGTFIGIAFAEFPFGGSNVAPCPAR